MSLPRLIIFTRCPDAGRCKTRLIPVLGAAGATALHELLVKQTLAWVSRLMTVSDVRVEVHFTGEDIGRLKLLCGSIADRITFHEQSSGDLGQRLASAFESAFSERASKVAIVGTDCPQLDEQLVQAAFQRLDHNDLVLGPAADGGYYLIALRGNAPQLFHQISWGQSDVSKSTLRIARNSGLVSELLATLADIDVPEDLALCSELGMLTGVSDHR